MVPFSAGAVFAHPDPAPAFSWIIHPVSLPLKAIIAVVSNASFLIGCQYMTD